MSQEIDPRFPVEVRPLWSALRYEVVWLHGRWNIFRQLWGTSQKEFDVMNQAAWSVFVILQEMFIRDIQLTLSTLADPAQTGKFENATLRALLTKLHGSSEQTIAVTLEPLIMTFEAACDQIRKRRNKFIAHFDHDTLLSKEDHPLEHASRNEIEVALKALRAVMNCVEIWFTKTECAYDHFMLTDDGNALLGILRRGLRYRELVEDGIIPREDLVQWMKSKL